MLLLFDHVRTAYICKRLAIGFWCKFFTKSKITRYFTKISNCDTHNLV